MIRLETVDAGLVALLERATDSERRCAALAAAEFARDRTGLSDDRVETLLLAVGRGEIGDTAERRTAEVVVATLDGRQWDLQDHADAGEDAKEDHPRAFSAARASSSAVFAADEDAHVAALEAIYEAQAATNDLGGVRQAVISALASCGPVARPTDGMVNEHPVGDEWPVEDDSGDPDQAAP